MIAHAESGHRGEKREAGLAHRRTMGDDEAGDDRAHRRRRAENADRTRSDVEQFRERGQQRDRAAEEDGEEIERHRREQHLLSVTNRMPLFRLSPIEFDSTTAGRVR
jgi:hypothetical protein